MLLQERRLTKISTREKTLVACTKISSERKLAEESLTILEPPPMTLEKLIPERTLKNGSLKRITRLETDENPEKANIQGVEIQLKKRRITGRGQPRQSY